MTKPSYTHVIVPVELHSLLKSGASEANTSIARYIRILEERSAAELSRPFEGSRVKRFNCFRSIDFHFGLGHPLLKPPNEARSDSQGVDQEAQNKDLQQEDQREGAGYGNGGAL